MAMKVESPSGRGVTVADIVRSFAKGVIGERIAVRKLEKLMADKYIEWYEGNGPPEAIPARDMNTILDAAYNTDKLVDILTKPVIHTDNL